MNDYDLGSYWIPNQSRSLTGTDALSYGLSNPNSNGLSNFGTISSYTPSYSLGVYDGIPDYSLNIGNDNNTGNGSWTDWLFGQRGTGANATSIAGLGLQALNGIESYLNNRKQLKLAKQNLNFQKDTTRANYINNATNWMNQNLWQVQALNDFNQAAGAERASNVQAGLTQVADAASTLGVNKSTFNPQQEALAKYNNLAS